MLRRMGAVMQCVQIVSRLTRRLERTSQLCHDAKLGQDTEGAGIRLALVLVLDQRLFELGY